jgi:hypothetical protein
MHGPVNVNVKKALQGSAMVAGKLNCRVKTDSKFLVDTVILYTKAPVRAAIQSGDKMDTA